MRRYFVAVLTALTVVIGLATVAVGTASAATPVKSVSGNCDELRTQLRIAENLTVDDTDPVFPAVTRAQKDQRIANVRAQMDTQNCDRGGNNGFPGNAGHNNGSWNDRLDGRYFRLDRGPALDICDSGSSNYDVWLNRNGSYRDRIARQLNAQRWNDLRRSDCAGTVVSDDGQCVTYVTARDNIRNYTNDYNRLRGVYNGDFNRLSRTDRDNLNRLYSLSNRYRNDWNTNLSKLRTVCQDNTPPVVVINEAPTAAVTVTQSAPAPVYAAPAPTSGSIPSGSVNTGGNSVAFTLAHARAI